MSFSIRSWHTSLNHALKEQLQNKQVDWFLISTNFLKSHCLIRGSWPSRNTLIGNGSLACLYGQRIETKGQEGLRWRPYCPTCRIVLPKNFFWCWDGLPNRSLCHLREYLHDWEPLEELSLSFRANLSLAKVVSHLWWASTAFSVALSFITAVELKTIIEWAALSRFSLEMYPTRNLMRAISCAS